MNDGIKRLDPKNQTDLENTIRLHTELLPTSPVARLGPIFMRRFYYRKLVEDGLMVCNLYYHMGNPAGFMALTSDSAGFVTRGFRRHWVSALGVLCEMVLMDPGRIGVIYSVARTLRKRNRYVANEISGELLSFGVLPEYRSTKFIQQTNKQISLEFFESAKEYFRQIGMPAFGGMVEAKNRATILFYHSLGCQIHEVPGSDGETVKILYVFPE